MHILNRLVLKQVTNDQLTNDKILIKCRKLNYQNIR
jgi:hypothetical protein